MLELDRIVAVIQFAALRRQTSIRSHICARELFLLGGLLVLLLLLLLLLLLFSALVLVLGFLMSVRGPAVLLLPDIFPSQRR